MYKKLFNKKSIKQNKLMQIPTKLIYINPEDSRSFITQGRFNLLCQSIKDNGVLQPIILRKMPNGLYQLICGGNRLRAVKELCVETIPAIILELSDEEIKKIQRTKNNYNSDNNPIIEKEKAENVKSAEEHPSIKPIGNIRGSKDARIFLNTVFKAVDFMKKAGVNIFLIQKESNERLEIKIKIKKE